MRFLKMPDESLRLLSLGVILLGAGLPVVDTQQIVVPEGTVDGPTPFGMSRACALCNWVKSTNCWNRCPEISRCNPQRQRHDRCPPISRVVVNASGIL